MVTKKQYSQDFKGIVLILCNLIVQNNVKLDIYFHSYFKGFKYPSITVDQKTTTPTDITQKSRNKTYIVYIQKWQSNNIK